MVCSMTERPLIFALANPDPEVSYNVVERARPDAIFASGRSDYPNQVNNVLAFPSIFRGALDVRATRIDEEMKLAACRGSPRLRAGPHPSDVIASFRCLWIVRCSLVWQPLSPVRPSEPAQPLGP